MAWVDLLARKFAEVLNNADLEFESVSTYTDQHRRIAFRYSIIIKQRTFFVSNSPISRRFVPKEVAGVIANHTNLNRRRGLIYRNKNCEPGLSVKAYSCGFWFQVWTPIDG